MLVRARGRPCSLGPRACPPCPDPRAPEKPPPSTGFPRAPTPPRGPLPGPAVLLWTVDHKVKGEKLHLQAGSSWQTCCPPMGPQGHWTQTQPGPPAPWSPVQGAKLSSVTWAVTPRGPQGMFFVPFFSGSVGWRRVRGSAQPVPRLCPSHALDFCPVGCWTDRGPALSCPGSWTHTDLGPASSEYPADPQDADCRPALPCTCVGTRGLAWGPGHPEPPV